MRSCFLRAIRLLAVDFKKMEQNETGCQAPESTKLCINNCGFFGSSATMNMCSKCHKDHVLKEQQAKLAASSIESMVVGGGAEPVISVKSDNAQVVKVELKTLGTSDQSPEALEAPPTCPAAVTPTGPGEGGPNRCFACRKRVGLTGFNCRCGHLFCGLHRYSEKHECRFDYRAVGRDAIAKANPVVKADKLDKI